MDNQSTRPTHLHSWRWRMRTLLMYFNNRLGVLGAPAKGGNLESINSTILFDLSPPKAFSVFFLFFHEPPHPFPVLLWGCAGFVFRGRDFKLKPFIAGSDCP
ncbi:hypothetical protein AGOR_G00070930 [Albula goreensis]|uniref:Uncharacterized protein n=1 Tax=Albula goreensis TaxID=1534307 RepID=A0A8T3DM55_9TELE|nr:hypothetical protein AGOR_G00070930 [Albula goreensis]